MPQTFDIKSGPVPDLLKEMRRIEDNGFEVLQFEAVEFNGEKFNQVTASPRKGAAKPEPLQIRELPDGPATIDDLAGDGETIVDYAGDRRRSRA